MDKKNKYLIPLSISPIITIFIPIFIVVFTDKMDIEWILNSITLHTTFEVACSVAVLILGCTFLINIKEDEEAAGKYIWITCSFIGMAIPHFFHAIVPPSNSFVWFYSLGDICGGVFFAMIWFPIPIKLKNSIPISIALLLTIWCLLGIIYPATVPQMIIKENFTPLANVLNLLGGVFYYIGAIYFLVNYLKEFNKEDFLFLNFCTFLGSAGILFGWSGIWQLDWWIWHLLRLLACIIILIYIIMLYSKAKSDMKTVTEEINSILDVSLDGKWLIDTNFNIKKINQTLSDMLSIPIDQIIGKKCYEIISCNLCNTANCPLKTILSNKETKLLNDDVIIKTNSGISTRVQISSIAVCNERKELIGISESYMDITQNKEFEERLNRENEVQKGMYELSILLQGSLNVKQTTDKSISYICNYIGAKIGCFYVLNSSNKLKLVSGFATNSAEVETKIVESGQSLIGQALKEKKQFVLENIPKEYLKINSTLGSITPKYILIQPFIFNNKVNSVVEIGTMTKLEKSELIIIQRFSEIISTAINAALAREKVDELLHQTQIQAQELQEQQNELKSTNEELEEKTEILQVSQERLKSQQEELESNNEELEEQTKLLETQKSDLKGKNLHLNKLAGELEIQKQRLEQSGKYKSEFLANMSHELRTPLNSLLLLAQDLKLNRYERLSSDELESIEIIYRSGNELLILINDILDLSKVEAGKIEVKAAKVELQNVKYNMLDNFSKIAEQKQLSYTIDISDKLPKFIITDQIRLEQILKNIVSNAFKFTENGSVKVKLYLPKPEEYITYNELTGQKCFAISISDTGIGIPADKKEYIFQAFQQVDGSISRKFGGTGLGLSISRELTKMLGGKIEFESKLNEGSCFKIYLPLEYKSQKNDSVSLPPENNNNLENKQELEEKEGVLIRTPIQNKKQITDDRDTINKDDKVLLAIEDDIEFARVLHKQANRKNFRFIHAENGHTGLFLAEKYLPNAIILDLKLPRLSGWNILEMLKDNPKLRHIPVHIMSVEEGTREVYTKGIIGYLKKPIKLEELENSFNKIKELISTKVQKVLIIEDNKGMQKGISRLITTDSVIAESAFTGQEAEEMLQNNKYDCIILDLNLPDITGFELLDKLNKSSLVLPPVIVYTGRELTKEENIKLQEYTSKIIIKGARSQERLLDETTLFLHSVTDNLEENQKNIIYRLHNKEEIFKNKTIMVVDDDMRNVFAISKVLKQYNINIIKAGDGQMALDALNKTKNIDLILMDIMMPVMDGYEAISRIRKNPDFKSIPIICLTAKAMRGDKEKCINVGANDYLAKPVNMDSLLSLIRIWLYK